MIRLTLVLCALIVALDAAEAAISKSTGFPYGWFALVQVLVYVAIGFLLSRRGLSVGRTLAAAAVTAFVEATFGWGVSIWIRNPIAAPSIMEAVVLVPVVIAVMTAFAAAGFGLASLGRGARSR